MKTHENFCAEIYRRRDNLIRKKKERRIALSCLAFALCFTVIGIVGLNGRENVRTLTDGENTEALEGIRSMAVAVPGYDEVLSINDSGRLSRIIELIRENEDSFIILNGELLQTEATDAETASETGIEETPSNLSNATVEAVTCPTAAENVYGKDIPSISVDTLPQGVKTFAQYTATITVAVGETDKAYVFTFKDLDGELVTVVLDAEKHPSVAEDIEDIINSLK